MRLALTLQRKQECCPSLLQETPSSNKNGKQQSHFHLPPLQIRHRAVRSNPFHIQAGCKENTRHSHLNVSACRTWQLAWCSNWSSSHRKLWQKEHRKIRPPGQVVWKTAGHHLSEGRTGEGNLGCGRVTYRDPTRRVHTLCSRHQSEDKHRHECSDISCCGTPKPHRSHILPPVGRDTIRREGFLNTVHKDFF